MAREGKERERAFFCGLGLCRGVCEHRVHAPADPAAEHCVVERHVEHQQREQHKVPERHCARALREQASQHLERTPASIARRAEQTSTLNAANPT
eukprot:82045-Rhodomonas_salina.10